ncbi:MAG: ABC transporter permease [Erysipelotrichaceae bacterium]|nr:ABC transporter permease [Erysipelotrichaceae bacterium]
MTKKKKKIDLSITNEKVFNGLKMLISILIALVLTFIILLILSDDPVNAFITILTGPLTKHRYIGIVLEKTVPYAFAGLACGILFKSGHFNLGAEGIFNIAGVVVSAVACNQLVSSNIVHPIIAFIGAGICGGLLMMIPAILQAKFNTNEMVLSLMLNSMYSAIAAYLVRTFLLTTTTSTLGTRDFLASAKIGYIIDEFHISGCFILLIVVTIILHIMLKKTKLGYQIRLSGSNPKFADYSGINSFKVALSTAAIAGVLAGFGSASQLLTQASFFLPSQSLVGIGFTGCLLAMLGQNNPIGIVVATFFIQYLEQGTRVLYFTDSSVPAEIVVIVEGVIVLLISSQHFLRKLRNKRLLEEGLKEHE